MAAGFSSEDQIPDPALQSSHVTLDTCLPLSEVQFPQRSGGDKCRGCCSYEHSLRNSVGPWKWGLAHTKCPEGLEGSGRVGLTGLLQPR